MPTLPKLTLARLQNEWDALPTVVVDSQHDLAKRRSLGLFVLDGFVLEVARLIAVSSVLAHYSLIVSDRLDGFQDLDLQWPLAWLPNVGFIGSSYLLVSDVILFQ